MLVDFALHFALEAIGSLIAIFAYRSHRCSKTWHKAAIWTGLTFLTTLVTVLMVG